MDKLMINLFSLIADQVRDQQELFDEEGKIMQTLLNNGYPIHEADAALMLMQNFVQKQSDNFFAQKPAAFSVPLRAMNREERERISVEAFGFISKLTRLGIISEDQREELVDKAMTVYKDRIEIEHIKSLVAFMLFVEPWAPEHDDIPGLRHVKKTAWN